MTMQLTAESNRTKQQPAASMTIGDQIGSELLGQLLKAPNRPDPVGRGTAMEQLQLFIGLVQRIVDCNYPTLNTPLRLQVTEQIVSRVWEQIHRYWKGESDSCPIEAAIATIVRQRAGELLKRHQREQNRCTYDTTIPKETIAPTPRPIDDHVLREKRQIQNEVLEAVRKKLTQKQQDILDGLLVDAAPANEYRRLGYSTAQKYYGAKSDLIARLTYLCQREYAIRRSRNRADQYDSP